MEADPFFVDDGDLEAARALVVGTDAAELFLYPGSEHLFTDSSLPSYDAVAAPGKAIAGAVALPGDKASRACDTFILVLIVLSVLAVMLESVAAVHERYAWFLRTAEWSYGRSLEPWPVGLSARSAQETNWSAAHRLG